MHTNANCQERKVPVIATVWLSRLGWRQSVLPCAISVPVYDADTYRVMRQAAGRH